MTADAQLRRVVDDINRRLEPDADAFIDGETLACYASMNRRALVTLRAAFALDRQRADAALRTVEFADARIALIDRLLRKEEETMPFTPEQLDEIFKYHAPSAVQQAHYEAIRSAARVFARVLVEHTPTCADQTAAVRTLREAVMTANAAIALDGKA